MHSPVAVRTYGSEGPVVVLIHGGPGAPGHMAPIARELAGAFRVLEPLQRLREEQPLTVATHIHDFHEVIAPRAKEPVHLVGSSWGAMLALACAAEHPRDVRSVVAIGCGTFDLRSRDLFKRRLGERMEDALKERIEDLEHQDLGEASSVAAILATRSRMIGRRSSCVESVSSVNVSLRAQEEQDVSPQAMHTQVPDPDQIVKRVRASVDSRSAEV